jgi:hypothetical protein
MIFSTATQLRFKSTKKKLQPAFVQVVPVHRLEIRDAPDIVFSGYPDNPKSGYRIPVSSKGRIPDIRLETWLDNYTFSQIPNKFIKTALTIIDFHDLVTKIIFVHIFFLPYLKEN